MALRQTPGAPCRKEAFGLQNQRPSESPDSRLLLFAPSILTVAVSRKLIKLDTGTFLPSSVVLCQIWLFRLQVTYCFFTNDLLLIFQHTGCRAHRSVAVTVFSAPAFIHLFNCRRQPVRQKLPFVRRFNDELRVKLNQDLCRRLCYCWAHHIGPLHFRLFYFLPAGPHFPPVIVPSGISTTMVAGLSVLLCVPLSHRVLPDKFRHLAFP